MQIRNRLAHRTRQQMGFSLIEALVAFNLISLTLLLLMPFQVKLFQHVRHTEHISAACRAQRSLAERIKACHMHPTCEQNALHDWQSQLKQTMSTVEVNVTQHQRHYRSTMRLPNTKKPLTFEFIA